VILDFIHGSVSPQVISQHFLGCYDYEQKMDMICGTWNSPPSTDKVKECVELHLHSPNTPSWHGAQLKKSTGTTLPVPYLNLNVRSPYGAGSLKTVAYKFAKYKLDIAAVQWVIWDKGGSQPAEVYTFFHGNGNVNHQLRTGFFVLKYVRELHQQLRGYNLLVIGCHI
jgi:hypothetical protein